MKTIRVAILTSLLIAGTILLSPPAAASEYCVEPASACLTGTTTSSGTGDCETAPYSETRSVMLYGDAAGIAYSAALYQNCRQSASSCCTTESAQLWTVVTYQDSNGIVTPGVITAGWFDYHANILGSQLDACNFYARWHGSPAGTLGHQVNCPTPMQPPTWIVPTLP